MKTIHKKKFKIKSLAELKKHPDFKTYSKKANARNRLANIIYFKRKELGLSQEDLAREAETEQRIISNIENGLYNPGYDLLNRIFSILGIRVTDKVPVTINWSHLPVGLEKNTETLIEESKTKRLKTINVI